MAFGWVSRGNNNAGLEDFQLGVFFFFLKVWIVWQKSLNNIICNFLKSCDKKMCKNICKVV